MKQFSKDLGNVSLAPKGKWSREQEYERLALVYNVCDNLSYVAKINVPSGVDIENREYWQPMNATGYADNNFINLTTENDNGTITAYESLEEAVATILPINRRAGTTLSFYNLNSDRLDRQAEFELWQFNSIDLANWENRDYWNNIYYNWNVFAGWYVGADALKNHVKIPNVGQYAYVGSNLNNAILYQCRTNGTWTNTGTKVRNYISVVVSGNITIGENGNWFSNGEDTGIPATPAIDERLDNIIMRLQQYDTEIDELQKQDVVLKNNIDSNFKTINNKVDNIKTVTDNKIDTADANLQNQITSNDTDIATLNTKHKSLSKTVQGIAATGGANTATNVTYDNDASGLNAENTQDAIDKLVNSENIKYNNKTSGLDAGNVQEAIDKVDSKVSDLNGNIELVETSDGGNQIYPSDVFSVVSNKEFSFAIVDSNKKYVAGIKTNGELDWAKGIPSILKKYIKNATSRSYIYPSSINCCLFKTDNKECKHIGMNVHFVHANQQGVSGNLCGVMKDLGVSIVRGCHSFKDEYIALSNGLDFIIGEGSAPSSVFKKNGSNYVLTNGKPTESFIFKTYLYYYKFTSLLHDGNKELPIVIYKDFLGTADDIKIENWILPVLQDIKVYRDCNVRVYAISDIFDNPYDTNSDGQMFSEDDNYYKLKKDFTDWVIEKFGNDPYCEFEVYDEDNNLNCYYGYLTEENELTEDFKQWLTKNARFSYESYYTCKLKFIKSYDIFENPIGKDGKLSQSFKNWIKSVESSRFRLSLTKRLKARYLEDINEWDLNRGDVSYKEMFHAWLKIYQISKEVNSDIKVVLGGLGHTSFISNLLNITEDGKHFWDLFDIYNYHYYGNANVDSLTAADTTFSLMDKFYDSSKPLGYNFKEKKVWVTETGDQYIESEKEQAENVIKRFLLSLSTGVDKIFYYQLMGNESNFNYNRWGQDYFGIIHRCINNTYIYCLKNEEGFKTDLWGGTPLRHYITYERTWSTYMKPASFVMISLNKTSSMYVNLKSTGLALKSGNGTCVLKNISVANFKTPWTDEATIWSGEQEITEDSEFVIGSDVFNFDTSTYEEGFHIKLHLENVTNLEYSEDPTKYKIDSWRFDPLPAYYALLNLNRLHDEGSSKPVVYKLNKYVFLCIWIKGNGSTVLCIWSDNGDYDVCIKTDGNYREFRAYDYLGKKINILLENIHVTSSPVFLEGIYGLTYEIL
jgi:hypothetical protein